MARRKAQTAKLPPPTARQCWLAFLKWALGVPLVVTVGLAIIGGALWLTGGQDLMWQTTQSMGEALFWIAGITLMYPLLLVMWVDELRQGLTAARTWAAMPPEAQTAAIAEHKPKRQSRKMG